MPRWGRPPVRGKLSSGLKASPAVIEIAPGWQALGFSTTSVERSSGQHAKRLLAVVEEASGVEDFVFDAIDSLGYYPGNKEGHIPTRSASEGPMKSSESRRGSPLDD